MTTVRLDWIEFDQACDRLALLRGVTATEAENMSKINPINRAQWKR